MKNLFFKFSALLLLASVAGCQNEQAAYVQDSTFQESCNRLPLETNRILPLAAVSNDWFQVYESHDQVYSIVEPYQFQMSISHLIVVLP